MVETAVEASLKLDFGSGENLREGFEGVDLYAPNAQHKVDLLNFPLPWAEDSVSEINMSHFLEHVPQAKRVSLFEEIYRILKPGGKVWVVVPSWKSERAYGDPTHEWPPLTSFTFLYFNRLWREQNKLTFHPYDIQCDFGFTAGPAGVVGNFAQRSHEAQMFACQHYLETYFDMWVNLYTRKGMEPQIPGGL